MLMYWKIMFVRCYCINSTKYVKIWEKYGTILCHRLAVNEEKLNFFFNIRLPEPRASKDSRWRSSFDSTRCFGNDKLVAVHL